MSEVKKAGREAHWDELDERGKIERLRQIVKTQDRVLQKMAIFIDQLVDHVHVDGKIMQSIRHPNTESVDSIYWRRQRDKDWF